VPIVLHPFTDVSVHVIQPPWVGLLFPHRMRSAFRIQ
jgi:hypothetical protein